MNKIRKRLFGYRFVLFCILAFALLVRTWGINFGLPQIQIIDEFGNLYFAFYTAANNLQPLRYFYGPLIPYILVLEFGIYFIVGKVTGKFSDTDSFFVSFLEDPTTFVLIGRITMALAGTFAVWVIWKIGLDFFNKRIGIISSFFLAFNFLQVRESHYIKEDVLAGLFVLITLYFCFAILKKGNLKYYIYAGVFFALGFGAKYPTGLILPVVVFAHLYKETKIAIKKLSSFVVSATLIFFATNPYFLIRFKESLEKTIIESGVNRIFYPDLLQGKTVFSWFFWTHIPQGIGIILFTFSSVAFLYCVIYALTKKEHKYLLIPIMPILFFTTIDFWSQYHFPRYSIMILPFFCLSAAILLDKIGERIKDKEKRTFFLILTSIFLIGQSLLRIIRFDSLISRSDTRSISANWVELNIPQGAKIAVESTIRPEYLSQLSTPVNLDQVSIDKRISDAKKRGVSESYLTSLKKANEGKIGYDIVPTPRIDIKYDIYTSEFSFLNSAKYYKDSSVEYLILSSWAVKPGISSDFEDSILTYYEIIAQFNPNPVLYADPLWVELDYINLDKINIFDRELMFGPVIEIYKLK